jgi:hypothetical protein
VLTVTNFSVGVHSVIAKYSGNFVYAIGTSAQYDQVVDPAVGLRPRAEALVTKLAAETIESGVRVSWMASGAVFATMELQRSNGADGPWGSVKALLRQESGVTVAEDVTADGGRTYYYRLLGTTTGGMQASYGPVQGTAGAPREFALSAAWPNPTRAGMTMAITLPRASNVRLSVIDLQGREVALLADGALSAGRHEVRWDGRTNGAQVPAGLYFIRYVTPQQKYVSRVTIAR